MTSLLPRSFENMVFRSRSKDASTRRRMMLVGGAVAGLLSGHANGCATAAETSTAIPNLASAEFGWQSNVADWQDPPAGSGHGPIKPDPDHPFISNAEGARTGRPPTKRIGN